MPRPRNKQECMKLCHGCQSDRYNRGRGYCERAGIDAPVQVDNCWHLDVTKALYCRAKKIWVMPCHTGRYQQWLAEWAETGKKPTWRYW